MPQSETADKCTPRTGIQELKKTNKYDLEIPHSETTDKRHPRAGTGMQERNKQMSMT